MVVSAEIIESNGNRKTRGEGLYQVMESEKSDNHDHTSSVWHWRMNRGGRMSRGWWCFLKYSWDGWGNNLKGLNYCLAS